MDHASHLVSPALAGETALITKWEDYARNLATK